MSFIRHFFKFVGTGEYIEIIFIGFRTDEYKVIFIGLGWAPMNIWVVWFNFNPPHIFVGLVMSSMNIHGLYSSLTWPN
jgi:hypothetical protein